jgi:hypothetical protein
MTSVIVRLYRRLDLIQGRRWFRICGAVLILVACGIVFGSLLRTSYNLDRQRTLLMNALDGQNVTDGDELARSLQETGTVTVGGQSYGDSRLLESPVPLFDELGNIIAVRSLVERLLIDERPGWAPRWLLEQPGTTWLLAAVSTVWLLLILFMGLTVPFLFTLIGTAIPVWICWALGSEQWMLAFAGIGLLTFTFMLLSRAALLLYRAPIQCIAVAHTVIKEASRTRIALVFIILLLIILPLLQLPIFLDPESPLRFRVQSFISRSLGLTFVITACLTLFLSCATVAFEIRDRQIWQLMTKPLGRFQYLLGKWIGVITINLILLVVAGVSTFVYIQYLRTTPVAPGVAGQLDILQLRDEVLTARIGTKPDYQQLSSEQLDLRVNQRIEREHGSAEEVSMAERRKIKQEIEEQYIIGQRSIPPGAARNYVFDGLEAARNEKSALTLRYRFYILRNDEHETYPAAFVINEDMGTVRQITYVPTMSHVLLLDPSYIKDDGTITITIANMYQPPPDLAGRGALNFEAVDFEMLYRVGSFEGNFFRAILISWTKLAFLAALGIGCATFLSFPVALLGTFTIFIAGMLGPFLATALQTYYPPEVGDVDWSNLSLVFRWVFESAVRIVARILVFLLSGFGAEQPATSLVEGRLIGWGTVLSTFLKLGLIWSGLALIFGWLVVRSRQLAIYSGHG